MRLDDCFELGHVQKPHGLRGEVTIFLDTDYPYEYEEMGSVFVLQDTGLIPFFIEHIQVKNDRRAIVKFEDVDSIERARELQSCKLYLPLDVLPELEGTQFYFHEIVGYKVMDEQAGEIGKVLTIYSAGAQDLFSVDRRGTEVLIPIHNEIIKSLDRENRILYLSLPDGLLELYDEADED